MSDQQERINRQRLIEPQNIPNLFERAFFKTISGPGATPYPADGLTPPTNVYYCRRLKNVTYTQTPGAQTLNSVDLDSYEYIMNLEPSKYIEEGSKIWGFKMDSRWYTIDKVTADLCTHRMYDLDGNLLWSKDFGALVTAINMDSSSNVYVAGVVANSVVARVYDSSGNLTLTITDSDFADGSQAFDVIPDSSGNILVGNNASVSKYNTSGVKQWTISAGGASLAAGTSGDFFAVGTGGSGSIGKYNSSGSLVATSPGGFPTSGGRLSVQLAQTTIMASGFASTPSQRYSLDLSTTISAYQGPSTNGIQHSGSSVWYAGDSGISALKATLQIGVGLVTDWSVANRGSATDRDLALCDTGNAKVLVAGDRDSNITHQMRDSANGDLLWEKDHRGNVSACDGNATRVVIGGERVRA